jgi:hypothetical protein
MITQTPRRSTHKGRPGANEMLDLTTWTRFGTGWVRIKGHYDVYCGMGNMHRRPVDIKDFADRFVGFDPDDVLDILASEWLNWDYDGCPCDDGEDTP